MMRFKTLVLCVYKVCLPDVWLAWWSSCMRELSVYEVVD